MPPEPIFLIDTNSSHRVAAALADLEQPFRHLSEILPQNTPDVDLFSELSARSWFLVTQDEKITRKPHERQAMVNAGIGAFIYTGKAVKSNVEMMQLVLKSLSEMLKTAARTRRPFVFGITDQAKFRRLDK